jgi:hypothetical protein
LAVCRPTFILAPIKRNKTNAARTTSISQVGRPWHGTVRNCG